MPIEAFLVPRDKRLSAEMNRDSCGSTHDFASLHREVDFTASRVSQDPDKFYADGLFQESRQ
jgi:hypothetical protein